VLVTKGDRLLLLKRRNVHGAGSWSTAGGHLEYGEAPEACAVREVKEETGVDVGDVRFIGITNDVFEEHGRHYITIWMRGEWVSGEPLIGAAYEMSEVGWFAWDDLPRPLFLPLQNLLDGCCYRSQVGDFRD
jgi:8-oxo-dGTP diphosphatase